MGTIIDSETGEVLSMDGDERGMAVYVPKEDELAIRTDAELLAYAERALDITLERTRTPLPIEREALTEIVKARATADGLGHVLAGHIRSAEARREATIYCEDARLREEIAAGGLIPKLQAAGLLPKPGDNQWSFPRGTTSDEYSITRKQSHLWQKMAQYKQHYDEYAAECHEKGEVPTAKGFLKFARARTGPGGASIEVPNDSEDFELFEPGAIVTVGPHTLICADNADPIVREHLTTRIALAFCDPPYNAGVADWDDKQFVWTQDWLIEHADIVAVTPGIGNIPGFMRQTAMPYKWSTATFISNGMTRGALGFGNWIYTALFSVLGSIHRNAQDVATIAIRQSDSDALGAKRQKPPLYLAWLFDLLTATGDVILDPFAGSGTSVLVAHQLGRRCIAVERDPETFSLMVARVRRLVEGGAK